MGGFCCCFSSKTAELNRSQPFFNYPVSEEREPLSPHATGSALSTGLLVDTNFDTSVPDTYRPPPAPIPYETYVGRLPTPSGDQETSRNKNLVDLQITKSGEDADGSSTLETKVKNLLSDKKEGTNIEMAASKEVEDEKSDKFEKSNEPIIPIAPDEEDGCPICLEEYDAENPKLITKCDHHFHLACVLEWMERRDTCPVCDQEMVLSPAIGG